MDVNGKELWRGQDLLLYRPPGRLPEDMIRVRAEAAPEAFKRFYSQRSASGMVTRHPAPALYFSVLGTRCMAAQMCTSDFDGDIFTAIGNERLLQLFKPCPESNFVPGPDGRPECETGHYARSSGSSLSSSVSGQSACIRTIPSKPIGLRSASSSSESSSITDVLAVAAALELPDHSTTGTTVGARAVASKGAMRSFGVHYAAIPDNKLPDIIREPARSPEDTTLAVLSSIRKQRQVAPVMTRAATQWKVRCRVVVGG